MKLTLALLADFANKTSDGKLNILGTFNRIYSAQYPAIHSEMKLVLRFELHPVELEQPKKLELQLRDDRGTKVFSVTADMTITATPDAETGEMVNFDMILGMNGFHIESAGRYEFVILVNGDLKGAIPFTAALRDRPPHA
jgi:hypothetical protein